ncbi:hypothetical protein C3L33_16611, partial [Rhododendron williamsianum]
MGRLFVVNLEGKIYGCKHCQTHLALCEDIVSKVSFPSQLLIGLVFFFSFCALCSVMPNVCFLLLDLCQVYVSGSFPGSKCSDYVHCLCSLIQSFQSRHGKAYLFNKVHEMPSLCKAFCNVLLELVNVTVGDREERMMMTGLHTVADIFCVGCGSNVGWKYEFANEKGQKYKEGKSVLERFKISAPDGSNYWASHEAHVGGSDADDV